MALSRLDLERIVDAIRELYRRVERDPTDIFQILKLARGVVLQVTPASISPSYCPSEIAESALDFKHKTALLELRERLSRLVDMPVFFGADDALLLQKFLHQVLLDLDAPKLQPAAPEPTLSTLDLPDIVRAVKQMYRVVETPPADDWQAPDWLRDLGYADRPDTMPLHVWIIHAAVANVRKALKLRTSHLGWTNEVGSSPFDARQKLALVRLCELMADISHYRSAVQVDAGKCVTDLDTLRGILEDLDAEPQAPGRDAPKLKPKAKRRGAPESTDPKADRKLCNDWKAAKGQGMTRGAFAREKGILVNDIISAQNREKYRRQRDAE
jgi:hypothetical protein